MKNDKVNIQENGVFVRGVAVSSTAKVIQRKDGSGSLVIVSHEIATQPGVIQWDEFLDPRIRTDVRLQDGVAIEFPKLKAFDPVTLAVKRFKLRGELVVVSDAQRIA